MPLPYAPQRLFNTQPQTGETNLGYGLRVFPQSIANALYHPFAPGQRLDMIHGGFLDALSNEAYAVTGNVGITKPAVEQAFHYALAPATGGPAPAKPPGVPASKPFSGASANPASFSPADTAKAASMPGLPFNIPAGAHLTSTYRTPEHNRDVGGVPNSYHTRLDAQGRPLAADMVPGQGQTMGGLFAMARQLNPGADVLNEGDHIHIEPGRGGAGVGTNLGAFQTAANAVGLNQPMPGFDASGYQRADQLLGQAQQNSMKPFAATYQEQPLPPLPTPEPLKAPDYTAGDAAFAAAQPKNPFGATPEAQAAGQLKMRRADYFSGMAQALASIDWSRGVGLGELFAKMGAGALMGAKSGDEEVRQRMDKFDTAMQGYQIAVANRDDNKARENINIANQNVQEMNQYKRDLWTTQVQDIQRHQPQIVDGVLVTKSKQQDGTVTETHTPLDPAKQTAALFARANNGIAAANAHNEYDWQTYRANREMAGAALPYAMADASSQGNLQGRDGIFAIGLSEASIASTETGQWENLYSHYMPNGESRAAQVKAEAMRVAGIAPGTNPTKEQSDQVNNYISSQLMQDFVNSGKSWVLVGGATVAPSTGKHYTKQPANEVLTSVANQRGRDQRISRSTNARGQTTTTVSGPAN